MTGKKEIKQFVVEFSVGTLLAVALGVALLVFDFGRVFIFTSYSLPFLFRPIIQPAEVVVIHMDEDSHKELKQSFVQPWDRALHAKLIERLTAEHARAVVFDVVFSDPGRIPAADDAFVLAARANGKVVLAGDYTAAGYGMAEGTTLTRPFERFREEAAAWGIAQLKQDTDMVVRQHYNGPLDPPLDSLGWATAKVVDAPVARGSENRTAERWVNYYGPPLTVSGCSYWQALYPDGVPAGFFSNKVVFVGAHLATYLQGERKDEFRSPFSASLFRKAGGRPLFMPGVEVQATLFLNLLRGDWLTRMSDPIQYVVIIFSGILLGIGLTLLRPLSATGVALLAAALVSVSAYILFAEHRVWFPWLIIVAAQIPVALLWSVLYNSFRSFIQNKLLAQSLGLYLSPKQVQRMLKDPDSLKPGGGKATVSILFSDIAGFSRISEQLDATALVQLLNSYYEQTIRCIHQTEGTVVDIIGDAIFAIWNAPEPQADHQQRMLRAALLFQKNVSDFNASAGKFALRTRVGLHTGEVVVGNVGSSEHFDFTAIGDNVNLSSRLEGLNKHLGTTVLLTRDALAGVDVGEFILRPAGNFRFKGLDKLVEVHELVITDRTREQEQPWLTAYAEAMEKFRTLDFDAAEKKFQRVLNLRPEDGLANFYLREIAHWRATPPPEGWAGEVEMKEK